jgi:gas vesicle protein
MNNFMKGLLVGAGIGLLCAPMKGEEMRQRIGERFNDLGQRLQQLKENEQFNEYSQKLGTQINSTTHNIRSYARQASDSIKQSAQQWKQNQEQKAALKANKAERTLNPVNTTSHEIIQS